MSRVRQIVITMTAWITWTQFSSGRVHGTLGFPKFGMFSEASITDKCHMGPNIQSLRSWHPCGHFDTYVTHRAHTGQTLEHFEVFHFFKSENKGRLMVRPYGSAHTPNIDPNNFEQEALDVGVQKNHRYVHRSHNYHRCVHRTHNPHCVVFSVNRDMLCLFSPYSSKISAGSISTGIYTS